MSTEHTVAFRWEAVFPNNLLTPTRLIGLRVEMGGVFGDGSGIVTSAEPYVDDMLGPGHWVTVEMD